MREDVLRRAAGESKLFLLSDTDSTNLDAKRFAAEGGGEAVFIAEHQQAGRGRLGRSFHSPRGAGLYLSFLLKPRGTVDGVQLTIRAAVAVCRAVMAVCGLCPTIKWVNDLQIGERKLCGILAEGAFCPTGELSYAVVGIGINVHRAAFPSELAPLVTCLDEHTRTPTDRTELAAAILREMARVREEDFAAVLEQYRHLCPLVGKEVLVLRGEERFCATVLSIEPSGALRLRRGEEELCLSSGEISLRPLPRP